MENNDVIIYETDNFFVFVPEKPHISREEGGHLCIAGKKEGFTSRLNLSPSEAKEFIRLSMLIGEAMILGLLNNGISISRINYQENGNWAFLKDEKPFFHLHLYGRATDARHQKWGEALYFPDPKSSYYDNNLPLNHLDITEIQKQIKNLENLEKYDIKNW